MHSNRIRLMPRELAEKIAAGEVIERPTSVIKELVENAIDAGATQIRIHLEDGGKKKLEVLDNGIGILAEELPLALERHATSKIRELDDLWNIGTLGFRGEALPSIATVSRFTIESNVKGFFGRKLYLEAGKIIKDESTNPIPDAHGTRVLVEDLFYNVPARLKFQKSKTSEVNAIKELLDRIALSRPDIEFELKSEGKLIADYSVSLIDREQYRLASILDCKPDSLKAFENIFEGIRVRGCWDFDGRASNTRYIFLSANGRMVRDKLLQQAVISGLRSVMMEGEFPRAYLEVTVPKDEIDVNVHPAKTEVRFRKSRDVFQVIYGAVEKLSRSHQRNFYTLSNLPVHATAAMGSLPIGLSGGLSGELSGQPPSPLSPAQTLDVSSQFSLGLSENVQYQKKAPLELSQPEARSAHFFMNIDRKTEYQALKGPTADYIGQLKNTYLLFQDAEGLILVDQHAAHERIRYEEVKKNFLDGSLKPQPLLISTTVKLKPIEVAIALDFKEQIQQFGFEFEEFGENTIVIRATPQDLSDQQAQTLFRALIDELAQSDSVEILNPDPTRISAKLERVLSTLACHSSIRAGQALSAAEAINLYTQMEDTPAGLNCPHGRPSSIRLEFAQIEGLFKRV